jgi:hypothetical protein
MIKHLLISITLVGMFAGCLGDFEPCTYPGELYCILPDSSGDACGAEGQTTYYVWYRIDPCGTTSTSFCATADTAQGTADDMFGQLWHGLVSTNSMATQPKEVFFCPTGSCVLGSEDGSLSNSFYVFDDSEIPWCEAQLDPDMSCTWPQVDNTSCGSSL